MRYKDQATTVFSEIASIIESSDNAENNIYDIVDFMIGIMTKDQLNALREFYVERFVDNMETKDLVQYVTDDMFQYMESLPDNEVIEECLNYWDDMFEEVIDDIKDFEQCDFKKTLADKKDDYLDSLSEGKDYGSKVDALVDSMGVTDEKVSTTHRRKDMDLL